MVFKRVKLITIYCTEAYLVYFRVRIHYAQAYSILIAVYSGGKECYTDFTQYLSTVSYTHYIVFNRDRTILYSQ